jgi:arginyl-tRNA synthetase
MLKQEIVDILESVGIKTTTEILEVPPQEEFGDLAFPCFELSKVEKRNPNDIAKEITKKIDVSKHPLLLKVEARSGYVNFFFYWEKITERVLKQIFSKMRQTGKKERIMVEYSQPNPVHPMHIGHARGTLLGDSLANIFDYLGDKTIRANYMNDTGLQVAKLVTAYILWGKNKRPKGKPDAWLWNFYVKFHEEAKKDSSLEEKAHETLRKVEIEKDKKTVRTWNKIVRWCVQGFEETYKKLGIKFKVYFYENEYRNEGKELVNVALMKNIAFKSSEGTIVSNLEKFGIPNFVLLRSDGTGLYQTSDLALTKHKFEKYKLDKSIWAVSTEQNLYFKQLFKVLELLDYPWVKNCYHFSFDLIRLPEGKMSSREGRAVMLDEVIENLIKLAYEEVNKRNPKLPRRNKMKNASDIAIGALKYAILKIEPENAITFDWKQMLSFEGNTGPYIQYAHTRCVSILNKAKKWKSNLRIEKLTEDEKKLIKELTKFSNVVEQAAKEMKPHYICNYVYGLATVFSNFYQNCPVLKAENEKLKNFRLTLVQATRNVLKDCLNLLGMEAVEKM